jgi:hypothetical protein
MQRSSWNYAIGESLQSTRVGGAEDELIVLVRGAAQPLMLLLLLVKETERGYC